MICICLRYLQRFGIGYDGAVEWLPVLESQCDATKRNEVVLVRWNEAVPSIATGWYNDHGPELKLRTLQ
jgi:hypothetical protein